MMETLVPSTKRYDIECGVTVYVLGMDASEQIHVSLVADWRGELTAFGPYLLNPPQSMLREYDSRFSGEILTPSQQERIGKLVLDVLIMNKEDTGMDLWFLEEIKWKEHVLM